MANPKGSMPFEDDYKFCAERLRAGSKSFYAASLLLPEALRKQCIALYAFCRSSDDVIDLAGNDAQAVDALKRLNDRLEAIYEGTPQDYVEDRVFSKLVELVGLPKVLPAALLEGYAWDVEGKGYETENELIEYCVRVAGTVGLMMAWIMGVRERDVFARACDLGVAMQLTNIARDVGEDARLGRLYLPKTWLRDAGVEPEIFLSQPSMSTPLGQVIKKLLERADVYYARGEKGIPFLPESCQPAIRSARYIYASIGDRIRKLSFNSVDQRAYVSTVQKLKWVMKARRGVSHNASVIPTEETQEGAYLLNAIV